MTEIGPGVLDLAAALRKLQQKFELERLAATSKLPDGHEITIQWSADELTLENDEGWLLVLDGGPLS